MTRIEILKKINENKKKQAILRARSDLLAFTVYTKRDYQVNWHHRAICHYLMLWIKGVIRRLMIFAPPRTGKSELVSRRAPAFILGLLMDSQIISLSCAARLASSMNRDVQRIIDSQAYHDVFPNTFLSKSTVVNTKIKGIRNNEEFELIGHDGHYRCAGMDGGFVGFGAEFTLIDDPHKNFLDAHSQPKRDRVDETYKEDIYSRSEKDDHILITNTRRHHDDLAGRRIKQMEDAEGDEKDEWKIINFPAIREEGQLYICPEDKRKYGEALWPDKFNEARYRKIFAVCGPTIKAALYDGNPSIVGGNLFKSNNFRYWDFDYKTSDICCWRKNIEKPIRIKKHLLEKHCFVDPALEIKKTNDFTCMQAWGYSREYKIWILLDRYQDRIEYTKILETILMFAFKNNCTLIGIENEKIGKIILKQSAGNDKIGGKQIPFKEIPTEGLNKEARANPMATYEGNERVFTPKDALWRTEFERNKINFPASKDDHDIDCMSMAATMESNISVAEILAGMG